MVVKAQGKENITGRKLSHCTASSKIKIRITLFSIKDFFVKVVAHLRDVKQVRVVKEVFILAQAPFSASSTTFFLAFQIFNLNLDFPVCSGSE